MVTQYGMSAKLGAVKYGSTDSEPFVGRDMGGHPDYSEAVAADIDSEVRALIEAAHDEAWEILVEYRDTLDRLVLELMDKEPLSREDMDRICAGVAKRPSMAPYNGFGKRPPSQRPPVLAPAESAALNGSAHGSHGAANGSAQAAVGDVGAPVQG